MKKILILMILACTVSITACQKYDKLPAKNGERTQYYTVPAAENLTPAEREVATAIVREYEAAMDNL